MNGILNVLKPAGMTSFDVVGFLRKVTGQKKIGHTGTLDPSAVGVLPVCLGNATRAIEFMMDKDKVYRAEAVFGVSTDTQDSSGKVLAVQPVKADDGTIAEILRKFVGERMQLPPMYSAIKIGGRKLYEIAREGGEIERQERSITIFDIEIIRIWDDIFEYTEEEKRIQVSVKKALFDVHCSKGTYIRTLCSDMGDSLGCGGHMSFLLRKRAGSFSLESAMTVEEIKEFSEKKALEKCIIPAETVFKELDRIVLDDKALFRYNNGVWIEFEKEYSDALFRVYDKEDVFIGIGELVQKGEVTYLKSRKFFNN